MSKTARVSLKSIFINNTEYPQIPPKAINPAQPWRTGKYEYALLTAD